MMRMRTLLCCAVAAALGQAHAAGDGDPTGLDLLYRCHTIEQLAQEKPGIADVESARNHGYCLGYLVGYVSGFAARDAEGEAGRFCPPVDARIGDFAAAVRDWLTANPAGLEGMGALVTLRALQWKFPCPEQIRQGGSQ
jgi:hypothetical protein